MHYQYLPIFFFAGFCISSHLKLIMPELHHTANDPVVILFSLFNPDFNILLNLHVYSTFNLSSAGWFCISSLSTALGTRTFLFVQAFYIYIYIIIIIITIIIIIDYWMRIVIILILIASYIIINDKIFELNSTDIVVWSSELKIWLSCNFCDRHKKCLFWVRDFIVICKSINTRKN